MPATASRFSRAFKNAGGVPAGESEGGATMESDVIARLCLPFRGWCRGLAPTLFGFLCLLGVARPALAQATQLPAPVPTRLTYTVASGCPDEHFFRTAVSGYLGRRDPFKAAGEQSLDVKVSRTGGTFKATIVFVDVHGERHPDKNKLDDPDCTQLVETAALVIMKWIDPIAPPAPAPAAPPPPPPPAPAPKAPEPPSRSEIPPDDLPPPPPPPKPPPTPIQWRVGAYVSGDYATVRGLVPAVSVSVGGRWKQFAAAIQGGWDAPAGLSIGHGVGNRVEQFSGDVLVCGRFFGWFVPCAVGQASQVQFFGMGPAAPASTLLRGAGGGRLSADIALPHRIVIQPKVDVLGAFGVNVYGSTKLPLPNVSVGVGGGVEFDGP